VLHEIKYSKATLRPQEEREARAEPVIEQHNRARSTHPPVGPLTLRALGHPLDATRFSTRMGSGWQVPQPSACEI
jgi:hypothetical protein